MIAHGVSPFLSFLSIDYYTLPERYRFCLFEVRVVYLHFCLRKICAALVEIVKEINVDATEEHAT